MTTGTQGSRHPCLGRPIWQNCRSAPDPLDTAGRHQGISRLAFCHKYVHVYLSRVLVPRVLTPGIRPLQCLSGSQWEGIEPSRSLHQALQKWASTGVEPKKCLPDSETAMSGTRTHDLLTTYEEATVGVPLGG